jgi:hypothetical protein
MADVPADKLFLHQSVGVSEAGFKRLGPGLLSQGDQLRRTAKSGGRDLS